MTDTLRVDPSVPDPAAMARASDCLRGGGLVAFPTETVYGLGVHALDRDAVRRLFAAKGRPATDPLIVHVSSLDQAIPLVEQMPRAARALAERFWPGPLTLVMRRSAAVPDEVTAGLPSVAIRVPRHPVARALLAASGIPIAAPSANLFSRPSPTCAAHVLADLDGRIDLVLDGGPARVGVESTVLDLSGEVPTILRPGAVTLEMLRLVLPDARALKVTRPAGVALPSPGLLSKHYAPRTPLTLYTGSPEQARSRLIADARTRADAGEAVVVLGAAEDIALARHEEPPARPWQFVELGTQADPDAVAPRLYAALREADACGADAILAVWSGSDEGLGPAIGDRLSRAAAAIVATA